MTAFAETVLEAEWGQITWEIRSVNHRYLDINIRLPEIFRHLEKSLRDKITRCMSRGKIDATLKYQVGQALPFTLTVNESMLEQLAHATTQVKKHFPDSQMSAMEVLSWQGVLLTQQTDMELLVACVNEALDQSLIDLGQTRQREGAGIAEFIRERQQDIAAQVAMITELLPKLQQDIRDKIRKRFEELSLALDQDRLEQEIVWLLQKGDIAEELQRLTAHLAEVERVLGQHKLAGRRLDFLMQECNREANTLGSKANDARVTKAVVEIKVQIEQIREQVQNVE